jgi:hypothetical protein
MLHGCDLLNLMRYSRIFRMRIRNAKEEDIGPCCESLAINLWSLSICLITAWRLLVMLNITVAEAAILSYFRTVCIVFH